MKAKLFLNVAPLLRLKHWVVRFFPRALLFLFVLTALSASAALSPTPRVLAADANKDAGRAAHPAELTRVAVRSTITWSGAGGDARVAAGAFWLAKVWIPAPMRELKRSPPFHRSRSCASVPVSCFGGQARQRRIKCNAT